MVNGKKVCGIICEYNPFHNGHKYHIEETKKQTGCEYVICAMSGSFVQRGDVAVYDKWYRARAALNGGADLVIELPAYYVLQSAQNFASGAVKLLSSLGATDTLSFGSESGDISLINTIAKTSAFEPEEFKNILEKNLSQGMGYPAAYHSAIEKFCGYGLGPNDTLAISYVSAIEKHKLPLTPFALKRDTGYHDTDAQSSTSASATAIREMIGKNIDISPYVPLAQGADTYDIHHIQSLILGFFRTVRPEDIQDVIGMEKGLENRLIRCACEATSLDEFYRLAVSKRYSAHRIKRVVLSSIMKMKPGYVQDYVRILALNQKGKEILGEIKNKSDLAIVTKTADFVPAKNSMFSFDLMSTDLAALCCNNHTNKKSGKDFTTSPVII